MIVIAALYDVHGNLPALEAVVGDAEKAGAEHYLLGGDYASFGAWPSDTLALLHGLSDATWIRGNWERWGAQPADAPEDDMTQGALGACLDALPSEVVADLAALPQTAAIDETLYCHASPGSDMRYFLPEPGADEPDLLAGVKERRLVVGHTHLAFQRESDHGTRLLNPGSVGMPLDGDPRAAYALIGSDGTAELRRVSYAHHESAGALRARYGDAGWAAKVARAIETATR